MPDEKTPRKGFTEYLGISASAMRLGSLGLTLAFSTLIGFWLGWFLDKLLKTTPALTILMLLLGIAAGFVNVWRVARIEQVPSEDDRQEDERESEDEHRNGDSGCSSRG